MEIPRRRFFQLAAGALTVPTAFARAADYPTRPVHIVVAYPTGGAPDIIARLVGQWLSQRLGQQFVIENRPGAANNIGTEFVAKAAPDGYTLLIVVSTHAVNATLYTKRNFDFIRDFAPVASISATPFIMLVHPAFPAKTIPEFIAYAKANPGKINMASQGIGTGPHMSGELFKMMTGIEFTHVPYREFLLPDLLGGQVQFAFVPIAAVIEHVKDGRLRALGVTPATRAPSLPDVPAIGEFVPGYAAEGWYGICAPAGTPTEIIAKLNAEISAGVTDLDLKTRLLGLGNEPRAMTPAEFGQFLVAETDKWAKVISFANVKVD